MTENSISCNRSGLTWKSTFKLVLYMMHLKRFVCLRLSSFTSGSHLNPIALEHDGFTMKLRGLHVVPFGEVRNVFVWQNVPGGPEDNTKERRRFYEYARCPLNSLTIGKMGTRTYHEIDPSCVPSGIFGMPKILKTVTKLLLMFDKLSIFGGHAIT